MKWLISFSLVFVFSCNTSKNSTSYSRNTSLQKVDTANLDLKSFASQIVGDEKTNVGKAKKILNWLSHNFEWKGTDYKTRTVKEIIARNGGNCYELARTYMAMINALNIQYRSVAEINIQPLSERRQKSAEEKVKEKGLQYSVFGLQHNDHRWVEVYDDKNKTWLPVDPSMNTFGFKDYISARASFTYPRMTIDTAITNDMLVPIAIFVTDKSGRVQENITKEFMVDEFDKYYKGRLSKLPSWNNWVQQLTFIQDKCKDAFLGKENLHNYSKQIAELYETYNKLKSEYTSKYGS